MTYDDILRNVRCCADRFCKNCSLQGKPMCKETLFAFVWDTMYNTKVENEKLKKKLDSIKLKMQPTAASGYKYENGNIVFFTDILNGYREEYDTTDKIVSQLNLLLHECYRLMECESHLCNDTTGQINCYFANGTVLTFYAGTGKIKGYEHQRGIKAFIRICVAERDKK